MSNSEERRGRCGTISALNQMKSPISIPLGRNIAQSHETAVISLQSVLPIIVTFARNCFCPPSREAILTVCVDAGRGSTWAILQLKSHSSGDSAFTTFRSFRNACYSAKCSQSSYALTYDARERPSTTLKQFGPQERDHNMHCIIRVAVFDTSGQWLQIWLPQLTSNKVRLRFTHYIGVSGQLCHHLFKTRKYHIQSIQ